MGRNFLASSLLSLTLAACGGSSGAPSDVSRGDGDTPSNILFFGDPGVMSVVSLDDATPTAGNIDPDRTIIGTATQLSTTIAALALDTDRDHLYVANGTNVLVFHNASERDGDESPDRTITGFGDVRGLFFDARDDVLYVADRLNAIRIFEDPDDVNGAAVPTRSLTPDLGGLTFQLRDVAVDSTKDILYVSLLSGATDNQVLVFEDAEDIDGTEAPNRTIKPSPAIVAGAIASDGQNNRLYVANPGADTVLVYDNASTVDSLSAVANRTLVFVGSINSLAVDPANDRLYAVSDSAIHVVNNAGTASGIATPTTLSPTTPGSALQGIAVNP